MDQQNYTKFNNYRRDCMHKAVSHMCLFISAFMLMTFLYDLIISRNNALAIPFILPGIIFIAIMTYTINHISKIKVNPYFLAFFMTVTTSSGISIMLHFYPFSVIASIATIILLILYIGVYLPLDPGESILFFSSIWITYVLPVLFYFDSYETAAVGKDNFFVFSAILLTALWSKTNFKQRKKVWILNQYCTSIRKRINNTSVKNSGRMKYRNKQAANSERMAFISQVIGSLVHDLNNFLTIILGKSYLISESLPEDSSNRHHIETVTKTCRKASELIKKLLSVSNNQVYNPCKKDLNEIVNEVKDMVTCTVSKNNIDFMIREASDLHLVKVDPLQIEQIILNLCINARDAMPGGGKLILETSNVTLDETYCSSRNLSLNAGEHVMISISDTGTGISKNIRSQIFQPFFTTKDNNSGTGLGLSSVKRIIKESKGDIIVYTEEGKGTVFKLFFPAYQSVPGNKYNTQSRAVSHTSSGTKNNKEMILVVDDNESILHMTSCMLKSHGFTVLEAKNSKQALSLVDSFNTKIDLLLSDVVLPEVSGKILYEKVKEKCPGIGVLYTSGFTSYLLRHYDLLDTTKDLIQKPFTTIELINKVKDSLKKKKDKKFLDDDVTFYGNMKREFYARVYK